LNTIPSTEEVVVFTGIKSSSVSSHLEQISSMTNETKHVLDAQDVFLNPNNNGDHLQDAEKVLETTMVGEVQQNIDPVVTARSLRKIDLILIPLMICGCKSSKSLLEEFY
jgi:hypothetical protein